MLSRTLVLLVAAAALGVVLLAWQAGAASAGTTTSTFVEREAGAVLVSDARGLHTSVEIAIGETERASGAGLERHLNASIGIFQSDSRRPKAQPVDLAGNVEGEAGALPMRGVAGDYGPGVRGEGAAQRPLEGEAVLGMLRREGRHALDGHGRAGDRGRAERHAGRRLHGAPRVDVAAAPRFGAGERARRRREPRAVSVKQRRTVGVQRDIDTYLS
ncbi:MAG: hypothetical protein E6I02_08450 [Chloroflexi bacterium]|nr:MAG: hypothetical protein E6I02_08450 [Chloroflexota bacterium]